MITLKQLIDEIGATATIGQFKDHTDPKYVGPGTWNVIHRLSFKARTPEQQRRFIDEMKEICYGFPCNVCMGHCTEYIKNHPIEDYLGTLVDINGEKMALGIFVWTWKFHNAVNKRISKPIMSWDTAYNLYSDSENLICSKNCLEAGDAPPDGLEHNTPQNIIPIIPEPNIHNNINIINKINKIEPTKFRMISVKRY